MIAQRHNQKNYLTLLKSLLTLLCFVSLSAFAADGDNGNTVSISDAGTVLQNIADLVPGAMRMITSIAYVIGMYFIIYGVIKLKHFGESRTMMSQEHSLTGPILYLAIGTLLLYLPTSVQIGMSTFWNEPSPLGYTNNSSQWTQLLSDCFVVIQLFGTIAFIRGLIMLTNMEHNAQPGTLSRALTHIIGGLLCINIYQFVQMILNTLGVGT